MLDFPKSTAADLDKAKGSAEYKRALKCLTDQEWRLNHLYWIKDENGSEIPFVMNEAQRAYVRARHFRNLIVKARQLGLSTLIEILKLDACMFIKGTRAAIIDATLDDASKKLNMIKFAYEKLPASIRAENPALNSRPGQVGNADGIKFKNKSSIEIGTSARGGTMQYLHVSEFGKIAVDRPDVAKEIRLGGFPAVHAGNYIDVESTAHGTAGEFYEQVERAKKLIESGQPLTALDFKLHFYGWWVKREYRLRPNLVVITADVREYFAKLAPLLKARHGVVLGADQIAWYQKNLNEYGPDDMKSEYPTVIEEAFFNSLKGAFWKTELSMARLQKRIGHMVPFDPSYRVNTCWDIGEDCCAVIFVQTDGLRHRVIDYFEETDGSLQSAAREVVNKAMTRGFVYDTHYGPHDLDHRMWAHESKTRKEVAAELGIDFHVVPQVGHKADSIEMGRRLLNMTWVDEEHCKLLVERWEGYRKRWNKALTVFTAEPVHDMSSHPADAWQQYAMGLAPGRDARKSASRGRAPVKKSAMSA